MLNDDLDIWSNPPTGPDPAYDKFWRDENVMCALFCIRNNRQDPYGTNFPEPDCVVHWPKNMYWFRDEYAVARRDYAIRMNRIRRLAGLNP